MSDVDSAPVALSDAEMHERIVSAVLDHRLPPGTRLVEDKLAAAFGVSRTRIRPVLARLASERLVTLIPNRGAVIAEPTPQEAQEVFEARCLIEPTLVERFLVRASDGDIAGLRGLIEAEEAARAQGDLQRAIRLSGEFHLRIAAVSGQATLGRILRELVSRTSLILMAYGPSGGAPRQHAAACGCDEHRALLQAIRLRIAPEATRLMREHLQRIEASLVFPTDAPPSGELADLLGL